MNPALALAVAWPLAAVLMVFLCVIGIVIVVKANLRAEQATIVDCSNNARRLSPPSGDD